MLSEPPHHPDRPPCPLLHCGHTVCPLPGGAGVTLAPGPPGAWARGSLSTPTLVQAAGPPSTRPSLHGPAPPCPT